MNECIVYLPQYDVLCIMKQGNADSIEIGFLLEFPIEFMATYRKDFTYVDSVYYGTQIEFIGFL